MAAITLPDLMKGTMKEKVNVKSMRQTHSKSRGDLPSLVVLLSGSALVLAAGLFFAGCAKSQQDPAPISTRETQNAQEEVKDYANSPTDEQKARVERAFSELDQEIHELEIRVNKTEGDDKAEADRKLQSLKAKRDDLRTDFTEEKFKALLKEIKESVLPANRPNESTNQKGE